MSVNVIDLNNYSDRIIHETTVDFNQRIIVKTIHLMQYDNNLPLIAVHLMKNGENYVLPLTADVSIRWGKKDHTFVKKDVIGCNEERDTVYFDVNSNMAYYYGQHDPIIEVKIADNFAGSSYIPIEIDRNPIQESDIESTTEYIDLDVAVSRAQAAAQSADSSADRAEHAAEGIEEAVAEGIQDIHDTTDEEIARAVDIVHNAVNTYEIGQNGQTTPSNQLVVGGIFYKKM